MLNLDGANVARSIGTGTNVVKVTYQPPVPFVPKSTHTVLVNCTTDVNGGTVVTGTPVTFTVRKK